MDIVVNKIINTENKINSVFIDKGKIYTFLNPVSYLDAVNNRDLFSQFDGIFADGSLVIRAIKLLYQKKVEKREFDMSSMARSLFNYAIDNEKTI